MDITLIWILGTGLAMSAIALVGSLTLVLPERTLERLQVPLVALAAGSLVGGALFHLLPAAVAAPASGKPVWSLVAAGFATFFVLEQLLHRHHRRHVGVGREPFTYLVLLGDGLHNFLGGLAIGGTFLVDVRLGLTAWFAAALHEVPQELGDFAVLVKGGWSRRRALLANTLSALTFPLGGGLAYLFAPVTDASLLVAFAAGNFLYIGASDLVPELSRHTRRAEELNHVGWFVAGLGLLWLPLR